MDLNIFIVLFVLFTGGHSLICYQCDSVTSSCVGQRVLCPSGTKCASLTSSMNILGNTMTKKKVKGCAEPQNCESGSINFGNVRSKVSVQCCNNFLCNIRDVPDYTSDTPNGKQCYSCDGISCFNKLDCLGTEDHCITARQTVWGQSTTTKGCASKLMCKAGRDFAHVSCCQGNLCNNEKYLHDSEENLDIKEDNLWDNEEYHDTKEDHPWDNGEKLSKKENLSDHEAHPYNSERNHRYSERNLRNSAKSITQSLHFLFWPLLSYIIYH